MSAPRDHNVSTPLRLRGSIANLVLLVSRYPCGAEEVLVLTHIEWNVAGLILWQFLSEIHANVTLCSQFLPINQLMELQDRLNDLRRALDLSLLAGEIELREGNARTRHNRQRCASFQIGRIQPPWCQLKRVPVVMNAPSNAVLTQLRSFLARSSRCR